MSEYSSSPDSTQVQPSRIELPAADVTRLLAVLADGMPRRVFRIIDALQLGRRDDWRVFPTLCALADEGRVLRTRSYDGQDVFTALPPEAPADSGRPIPDALADATFIRLLARQGVPLPPDPPASPNWREGTRDDAERWLRGGGNVGLLLKGLVVLDLDPKHTVPRQAQLDRDMAISVADDLLSMLTARCGVPPTLMERTRSGGLHLIYRAVPKRRYAELPIPEWRGDGGPLVECRSGPRRWIILSPSTFAPPLARMQWLRRTPLAPAPDWLPWTTWQAPAALPPGLSTGTADALAGHFEIRQLLRDDGWTLVPHRDGYLLAVRPGKDASDGASGTLDRVAPGVLHVFSTAAPVPPGNYNSWSYLVASRYAGNALAALAAVGGGHE